MDKYLLSNILKDLWGSKNKIILGSIAGFIVGVVFLILTPSLYKSSATFVPQTNGDLPNSSSLNSLAAIAGINLLDVASENEIPPSLYPQIVQSVPFLLEILSTKVVSNSDTLTYHNYLYDKRSLLSKTYEWIKNTFSSDDKLIGENQSNSKILSIPDSTFSIIESLQKVISINVNENDGYLSLSVIDESAEISAIIAAKVKNELQNKIIEFNIEKTKALYDYTSEIWMKKKVELYNIQDSLTLYSDNNRNITTSSAQARLQRIQAEYNTVYTVYTELATQKENLALQLEKDTPVFSVIDPVRVPNKKYYPRTIISLLFFGFIGTILSALFVVFWSDLANYLKGLVVNRADDVS